MDAAHRRFLREITLSCHTVGRSLPRKHLLSVSSMNEYEWKMISEWAKSHDVKLSNRYFIQDHFELIGEYTSHDAQMDFKSQALLERFRDWLADIPSRRYAISMSYQKWLNIKHIVKKDRHSYSFVGDHEEKTVAAAVSHLTSDDDLMLIIMA